MRGRRLTPLVLVLLASGCAATGFHRGEVLQPPTMGDGDPARDHWVVMLELEGSEIVGTDVVYVGFFGAELTCEDGRDLDPSSVEPGTTIGFSREGDEVDMSSPPAVAGDDLRADCGS